MSGIAESRFQRLPKVELHHHLEGSIRTKTYIELIHERRLEELLPVALEDVEAVQSLISIPKDGKKDFLKGLSCFRWLRYALADEEAIARLTFEAIEDAAFDGVRYLELRFSPGPLLAKGLSQACILRGLRRGVEAAEYSYPIRTALIAGINREQTLEMGQQVVDLAIAGENIFGVDILSDESYPAERFAEPLKRAKAAGLGITIHAGEFGGADNIWIAAECLQADRIGHGTHLFGPSGHDAVGAVRQRDILIECCPSANVAFGVLSSVENHPLMRMKSLQIPVNISTDDPMVVSHTLCKEYEVLSEAFGLKEHDFIAMALETADYIFDKSYQATLRQIIANYQGQGITGNIE